VPTVDTYSFLAGLGVGLAVGVIVTMVFLCRFCETLVNTILRHLDVIEDDDEESWKRGVE
jgi:hypothetical protein